MAIKAKSKDEHKIHCWEVIHKYESKEKSLKGMNQLIAKSLRITNKLEKLNVLTPDELDYINYMTGEYLGQVQINYLIYTKVKTGVRKMIIIKRCWECESEDNLKDYYVEFKDGEERTLCDKDYKKYKKREDVKIKKLMKNEI